MNRDIADVLKGLISGLPFIDKLAGCVQTIYIQQIDFGKYSGNADFSLSGLPVIKLPGILSSKPPIYDLYCPDSKASKKSSGRMKSSRSKLLTKRKFTKH